MLALLTSRLWALNATLLPLAQLEKTGLASRCVQIPIREASREEALRCHTAEHCDALNALEHAPPRQVGGWFGKQAAALRPLGESSYGWSKAGSDMYHTAATPKAARLAAGAVLSLTERVCDGRLRSGFAVVRPPGHHACSDRMCGFCFLNSAAMACKAAVEEHGMSRVLLLDWDVHHGNGSQQIFEDDPVRGRRLPNYHVPWPQHREKPLSIPHILPGHLPRLLACFDVTPRRAGASSCVARSGSYTCPYTS